VIQENPDRLRSPESEQAKLLEAQDESPDAISFIRRVAEAIRSLLARRT